MCLRTGNKQITEGCPSRIRPSQVDIQDTENLSQNTFFNLFFFFGGGGGGIYSVYSVQKEKTSKYSFPTS